MFTDVALTLVSPSVQLRSRYDSPAGGRSRPSVDTASSSPLWGFPNDACILLKKLKQLPAVLPAGWLPIADAFRTFTACPTPAIRAVFSQIQQLAGI